MKNLRELFFIFLKIGCFMFGGGSAMLPLLQEELVDKRHWLTKEQLVDYYSIGQSTPGIIAVNVATFTGYNRAGVVGAILATFSLILAPVVVILLLAHILQSYMETEVVKSAFVGIRIVVVALIIEAVCGLWSTVMQDKKDVLFFVMALGLAVSGISVAVIMFLFCLISLFIGWRRGWK